MRRRVAKRTGRLAATATLVALVVAGCGDDRGRGRLVLHDVTLFDGTGSTARPGMVVAVAGDRIDVVVPVAEYAPLRSDSIVDASGLHLIPGLWDLHVHLSKTTAAALPVLLANGVTTVRDMGGLLEELRAMRAEVRSGRMSGPRIFMAGPMLEAPATLERMAGRTTTERYRETRIPVPDTARARVVVDSLAALGVDFIKIREYASDATYRAVVEAAAARGLRVAGHAPFSMNPVDGAALGVVSFEHASYPYPLPDADPARAVVLEAFRSGGVAIVPTLVAWETNVMFPDSLRLLVADSAGIRDPRRRLIADGLVAEWARDIERFGPRAAGYYDGYWGFIHRMSRDLAAMHEAGVPILPGSDLAGPGLFPGFALHDELERMVNWIGLDAGDVLISATRGAAGLLGATDSLGTIEPGKLADMVLLEADPLADIRNTRRIRAVVKGGEWISPARIRAMLNGLGPTARGGIALSRSFEHPTDRRVALTFDDLPMTGGDACDTVAVRDITRRLTGVLEARSLPAAGLATPGRACLTAELLKETLERWLAVGAILGNHTATHPDINTTPVDAYLADIDWAQELIDAAVSTDERWFRPPLLHSGDDLRKKQALDDHLAAGGYRVAPVTVDNQEWVYAAVYADARRRGDDALARKIADAYLEHLEESMAFYEILSLSVFDREIPQVLLLHANRLNAEHLGQVVGMLAGRGYRFVSLPDALADPAYERPDTYVGQRGLSWLQRWAIEDGITVPDEPREAPWVAEAFRASR